MRKLKSFLSIALAAMMMMAMTVTVGSADGGNFTDVKANDWFAEGVAVCYDYGIVNGTSEDTFSPEKQITRAEFVTMLYRMDTLAKYNGGIRLGGFAFTQNPPKDSNDYLSKRSAELLAKKGDCAFTDVDFDEYYAAAVIWASEKSYVNGTSETEFSPNAKITREQLATMLYRYQNAEGLDFLYRTEGAEYVEDVVFSFFADITYGKEVVVNTATLNKFTDGNKVSDYAKESVSWANQSGYLNGVSDTVIQPQGTATRAQVATILARMLVNVEVAATDAMYYELNA